MMSETGEEDVVAVVVDADGASEKRSVVVDAASYNGGDMKTA